MKRTVMLLALILLGVYTAGPCAGEEPDPVDEVVSAALGAAFRGDAEDVRQIARVRLQTESLEKSNGAPAIAGNIAVLAVTAENRPLLLEEVREALDDFGSDQATRHLERLVREREAGQRFLEARKDVRYEHTRRIFNGFASPVTSLAQGQFFSLFAIPFEVGDFAFVGVRFLTPEQRKELHTAREVVALGGEKDGVYTSARSVSRNLAERRRNTAALQAKQNAQMAGRRDDLQTALFWYDREGELKSRPAAERSGHRRIIAGLAEQTAARNASLTMDDGDSKFYLTDEFGAFSRVLQLLFSGESGEFEQAARDFLVDYPYSTGSDEVRTAIAARAHVDGEALLSRVYLQDVARGDDEWADRAARYLERPVYTPSESLEDAQTRITGRFRDYLLLGRDPGIVSRSLTPEEARIRRQAWIYQARGLFVTDIIGRALFLPFVGPFPKPELVDAAARIDAGWFSTPEGRVWRRRVLDAQVDERRYQDAIELARAAGDATRAVKLEQKAARHLEQLAEETPNPRQRAAIFQRLLNAYPAYRHRDRVEEKLAEANTEANTVSVLDLEELRAYPELWRDGGLRLGELLLDGSKTNGEISRDGVSVLVYPAYSYIDRATDRRIEVPMEKVDHEAVLRLLEPRRRTQAVREELKKPLPRRKIPIAVEAGAFPGFDISPGLVPLSPNPDDRRLYE